MTIQGEVQPFVFQYSCSLLKYHLGGIILMLTHRVPCLGSQLGVWFSLNEVYGVLKEISTSGWLITVG